MISKYKRVKDVSSNLLADMWNIVGGNFSREIRICGQFCSCSTSQFRPVLEHFPFFVGTSAPLGAPLVKSILNSQNILGAGHPQLYVFYTRINSFRNDGQNFLRKIVVKIRVSTFLFNRNHSANVMMSLKMQQGKIGTSFSKIVESRDR